MLQLGLQSKKDLLIGRPTNKTKSQMSDTERVRDFQRKLYQKAKQEESFRFYVLYDKVRLPHFLRESYKRCKANGGSAGSRWYEI